MKRAVLPIIAALFLMPTLAQADSPYGALQSVHEKYDTQRFTQNVYAARFAFRRGVGKNDHGE